MCSSCECVRLHIFCSSGPQLCFDQVVAAEAEAAPELRSNPGITNVSASLPDQLALPAGWIALYDAHGRLYYQNDASKTTQWEHPAKLPPGWVALRDDHGMVFYQNNATHVTQWEHPGLTAPPGPSSHAVATAIKAVQRALPEAILKDVCGANVTLHLGNRVCCALCF